MTNIIFHIIPDDVSISSSSSSDHNNISSSHDENLATSRFNIEALSLYSVIGRACMPCTRISPELIADDSIETESPSGTGTTTITQLAEKETQVTSGGERSCVIPASPCDGEALVSTNLKIFSFQELKIATLNFGLDFVIRRSVYTTVFKGWLDEHTLIATKPGIGKAVSVKRFDEATMDNDEWLAKVKHLGSLNHPNMVRLLGYCLEDKHRLLIYEFMPRSLEDHFSRSGSDFEALPWSLRIKVALGAAKGLAFLHSNGMEVTHGAFQPSNILLDSSYNARLSDFGLRHRVSPIMLETIYGVMPVSANSTNDYSAPEIFDRGKCQTAKSDVFSFGIVLLEMLLGRRLFEKNLPWSRYTLTYELAKAKRGLNNKDTLLSVLDSRLQGQNSLKDAQQATAISCLCTEIEGMAGSRKLVALGKTINYNGKLSDFGLARDDHTGDESLDNVVL